MSISLEEAIDMMTPESYDKLREVVTVKPNIHIDNKVNCDILMQALCRAVQDDVIHIDSLDDQIIKLLNTTTSTLSPKKLGVVLTTIRQTQHRMGCVVSLIKPKDELIKQWVFVGPKVNLIGMFGEVLDMFKITPHQIRTEMTETLKPTIVNNIGQLVAKYQSIDDGNYDDINVSINTITRLVNMSHHVLYAEFKDV